MDKLPKAPLQEAVFELRWDLDIDSETQQELDLGYELAQGKLHQLAEKEFPVRTRRAPAGLPSSALNYKVVHQFWKGDGVFPVVQLGPGLFTVNDTDLNYNWNSTFFPLIKRSLIWLYKAYEDKIQPNFVNLRYIDSVKLTNYDFSGDWLGFIKKNLKVDISNNFDHRGALKHININQSFDLSEGIELNITINSGLSKPNDQPVLIWQIGVIEVGQFQMHEILSSLERAHEHTHNLFVEMTKGQFYDSFK